MKLLVCVLALAIVAGCASPKNNYRPKSVDVSFPEIDVETQVGIGEEMLRQGQYTEVESIRLGNTASVGLLGAYTFGPGYYSKTGGDAQGDFYQPAYGVDGGAVTKSPLADPFGAVMVDRKSGELCGVSAFGGKACTSDAVFERVLRPVVSENNFQQTLIYNGRTGRVIRIGYREFSGNIARPAFSNEVQYDLNEGREIGYKGALVEVLEAGNRSIRYRVIRNFSQTQ